MIIWQISYAYLYGLTINDKFTRRSLNGEQRGAKTYDIAPVKDNNACGGSIKMIKRGFWRLISPNVIPRAL